MDSSGATNVAQELGDLELAVLVCFLADQHCIVRAPEEILDEVQQELELIVARRFRLKSSTIVCYPDTTLEEFSDGLLVEGARSGDEKSQSILKAATVPSSNQGAKSLKSRKTADVVIAKNLDRAHDLVQIQALELMRSRRVYTPIAIHAAPKRFLLIGLVSTTNPRPPYLTPHLNDYFFISHTHNPSDGLPHSAALQNLPDTASITSNTSILHQNSAKAQPAENAPITNEVLTHLQNLTKTIRTTAEIRRYTHNITTFLRLHRAVAGGVSALASRHFTLLTHILPPLHALSYTPPSLIQLAALKAFPHRLQLATPQNERSLQWGSSTDAVAAALEGVTAEGVVRDVLGSVECPV